jgi:hypothetical protein
VPSTASRCTPCEKHELSQTDLPRICANPERHLLGGYARQPTSGSMRGVVAKPEMTWDELLDALEQRTGMFVARPRLLGCSALLIGYSLARGDHVMRDFQSWMSHRFPVDRGYPSPLSCESLVSNDLFGKTPWELSEVEDQAASERLCQLLREYRAGVGQG